MRYYFTVICNNNLRGDFVSFAEKFSKLLDSMDYTAYSLSPKIIVVTDKNWESCEKYEVWKI